MPTCNPKLKYSHAITHDATTIKGPRPTACCYRAAEIFNFRLIRSDPIARNFILCLEPKKQRSKKKIITPDLRLVFHRISKTKRTKLILQPQPPPQALRFSQGRGERETRVTGDEPQGTMGRVQTAVEASLCPSRLPLRAHFHQKRDVWVRGNYSPSWEVKW